MANVSMLVEDRLQTLQQNHAAVYTHGSNDPETRRAGFSFTIPVTESLLKEEHYFVIFYLFLFS